MVIRRSHPRMERFLEEAASAWADEHPDEAEAYLNQETRATSENPFIQAAERAFWQVFE